MQLVADWWSMRSKICLLGGPIARTFVPVSAANYAIRRQPERLLIEREWFENSVFSAIRVLFRVRQIGPPYRSSIVCFIFISPRVFLFFFAFCASVHGSMSSSWVPWE